jgi:hypothetical protein
MTVPNYSKESVPFFGESDSDTAGEIAGVNRCLLLFFLGFAPRGSIMSGVGAL